MGQGSAEQGVPSNPNRSEWSHSWWGLVAGDIVELYSGKDLEPERGDYPDHEGL